MSIFDLTNKKKPQDEKGFTLIELSIVLVIIGLIIGGILTGQDLIKAAEQRATLAQIEKYNTAVNTFRNKFGGIPGDLQELSATNFGLFAMGAASTVGGAGWGDGNGLLEGGALNSSSFQGEVAAFFRQLADANLVDGTYAQTGATAGTITTAGVLGAALTTANSSTGIALLMPAAKLGRGNFIAPYSASGINYYVITGLNSSALTVSAAGAVTAGGTNNLTANEGYNMDKKVDDGLPGTGQVLAWDGTANSGVSFTNTTTTSSNAYAYNANGTCATSATQYNVTTSSGPMGCSLRFRFN